MGKYCEICGKPSGMYPLCANCFELRDKGKVVKCENCGKWHYKNKPCDCQTKTRKNIKTKKTINEDDYDIDSIDFIKTRRKNKTEKNIIEDNYDIPLENFTTVSDTESIDFRKRFPCEKRCQDGHYVRSNEEKMIDDYLYTTAKLLHSYEEKYRLNEKQQQICKKAGKSYDCFYPDFYILELNLYIEYFGRNDEKYNQKMDLKIKIFKNDSSINFDYLTYEDNNILTERLEDIITHVRNKK